MTAFGVSRLLQQLAMQNVASDIEVIANRFQPANVIWQIPVALEFLLAIRVVIDPAFNRAESKRSGAQKVDMNDPEACRLEVEGNGVTRLICNQVVLPSMPCALERTFSFQFQSRQPLVSLGTNLCLIALVEKQSGCIFGTTKPGSYF